MIDSRNKLTVLSEAIGSFTDHSNEAVDYLRDDFTATGAELIYVGFTKPINAIYAELTTPLTAGSGLVVEAWDGSQWSEVSFFDETAGLSRSGFITWDRQGEESKVAVDGKELFWVRLNYMSSDPLVVAGLNIVLSDDAQLEKHFPNALDPRVVPSGFTSHIASHVSARDSIIQRLRIEGYIKYDDTSSVEDVTPWDLLDIFEFREAATFWALARIFFNLSDNVDDLWWQKHEEYRKAFEKSFSRARLSIDKDDDGEVDADEDKIVHRTSRVVR